MHWNPVTEKGYVGQTTQGMMRRWGRHLTCARLAHHVGYNTAISKAIRKHGVDAFEHQMLSVALQGHAMSTETCAKISAARTGHKDSLETRAKKSASKSTPEARAANSARVKAQWAEKRKTQLVTYGA